MAHRERDVSHVAGPVIEGPRLAAEAITVLRTRNPHCEFTDPPFWRSLPTTLALAASAGQAAAVLTGPHNRIAAGPAPTRPARADDGGMVPVCLEGQPLSATAGLVWSGDLPRQLQRVLFDTADGIP